MKEILALGAPSTLATTPLTWHRVPSLQVEPGKRYRFATKYNGGTADEIRTWLLQALALQDVRVFLPSTQLPGDWPADDTWRTSPVPTFRAEGTWTRPPQVLPIPAAEIVLWCGYPPAPPVKTGPSPMMLWGTAGAMVLIAAGLGLYAYNARRKK
jgi:hypothetical protein